MFGAGTTRLTLEAVIEGQLAHYVLHTGVVMHRGHVVVRRHALDQQQAERLAVDPLPLLSSSANGGHDHLTHSRVIVRRGAALTSSTAFATSNRTRHRLVAKALDGAGAEHIEVSDTRGVSGISACREEDRFVSGGFDGEIDLWQWDSGWHSRRVRAATNQDDSIRELVTARDGQLVAVTSAGVLLVGSPDGEFVQWKVSLPGRPRSLAAHPHEDLVAVGLKGGGWTNPASEVALVRLD